MGVEPQEGQARASHRRAENQQLARARNVGNEQVLRKNRIARDISKHTQSRAHQNHRHGGQTIEAIGKVDCVAGTNNDQEAQDHKTEDTQRVAHLFEEGQKQTGLRRQADVKARAHPSKEQLPHAVAVAFRNAEYQIERSD